MTEKKYAWTVSCSMLEKREKIGFCVHRNQKVRVFDCARCVGFTKIIEDK